MTPDRCQIWCGIPAIVLLAIPPAPASSPARGVHHATMLRFWPDEDHELGTMISWWGSQSPWCSRGWALATYSIQGVMGTRHKLITLILYSNFVTSSSFYYSVTSMSAWPSHYLKAWLPSLRHPKCNIGQGLVFPISIPFSNSRGC